MTYVFDSSSLIYLGKIKLLEKISGLEGKKLIPAAVYEEVVKKGLERREPEAKYIESLVGKGKFEVARPKNPIQPITYLSRADSDVLSLAKERAGMPIIDEAYASGIAESMSLEPHGSIYLILMLLKKGEITKSEATECLDRMVSLGFYLSAELYREVSRKIEGINPGKK